MPSPIFEFQQLYQTERYALHGYDKNGTLLIYDLTSGKWVKKQAVSFEKYLCYGEKTNQLSKNNTDVNEIFQPAPGTWTKSRILKPEDKSSNIIELQTHNIQNKNIIVSALEIS